MIDRHVIKDSPVQYTHGRSTYANDVHRIVVSVLEDTFKIGEVNPDVIYSPIRIPFELLDKFSDTRFILNLHDDSNVIDRYVGNSNITFITHYKPVLDKYKNKVDIRFIPMSIDTSLLPDIHDKVKDSIIYFGNIYPDKKETYEMLKNKYSFDTLSFSKYNGGKIRLTQKECWDIVSRYEYGVGVGRSAIEMLCMGLKVIIGGKGYGGNVTADNFQNHWDVDFDSSYYGEGDNYVTILRRVFDMRNYINDYIKIIESVKI